MENQQIKNNHVEVYDIETLSNLFSYVGLNVDTQEEVTFVIHESRNDLVAFIKHLETLKGMVGYNNLRFDYPIIHYIIQAQKMWGDDGGVIAALIYQKAQEIIDTPEEDKFNTQIPEWHHIIPQLDLYALNHFDNPAKRTSLKDLEFWMNYPNVQDMPISHKEAITTTQIPMVLEYNLNDVKATYAFYKLCKDRIQLRKDIGKQYGLKMTNYNDPRIGSEIFLDLLSKDMKIDKKDLRKKRTFRKSIKLGEIILPGIKFNSPKFQSLLGNIKNTEVVGTKGEFKQSVVYKGFKYDLGQGGAHGCIKSGVYCADDEYIITDIDVSSYYPNLAINNGFKPAHLGDSFCRIYKSIYETRAKAKKEGNKALNEGLKLSLNGTFGKAGDKNSYLYDQQFLLSITINGQLLLLMLIEKIVDSIENVQVLQINTDGITIKYKKENKETVGQICDSWIKMTKLELEFKDYSKMVIQDVNNYQAIDTKGNIKSKGLFEITKEFHKDTSFKIVPIAITEYFVKRTPIMETLINHKNIYDFCGRAKFKKDSFGETRYIGNSNGLPVEIRERQQKTTRYYISKKGSTFMKVYPEKKKESFINKGFQVTIFNKFVAKDNYDVNYDFYYKECLKVLQSVEDKQLQLL